MADEKKRIIDLSELSQEVQVGQYILVDSASGTGKMNLKKIVDDSTTSLAERVTDLETGLTEEENARIAADTELSGNVSNLQTALETKADNNGYYPDLYAGNLSSTRKQTDSIPYIMRKTGGDLSRIGEREHDTLVGATVNVNQLVDTDTSSVTIQSGHKYYAKISGTESIGASAGTAISVTGGTDMVIDLTQMFGTTIADYLYSLETATAGAGIAKLKEWGFLTGGYIPYNPGMLESVEATAHKMVGFNQWDEEWEVGTLSTATGEPASSSTQIRSKNFIPVVPNVEYYNSGYALSLYQYDADYEFISYSTVPVGAFTVGANTRYIKFWRTATTYNHDICINISNPDRNGEYEPYKANTYDLGTDTLRGLFKLDSNNNLYAEGDTKTSDGTVTRKYKKVTLDGVHDVFNGAWGATDNGYAVYATRNDIAFNARTNLNIVSDNFTAISTGYRNMPLGSFVGDSGASTTITFILPSTVTTVAEANAWLTEHPTTIVYELATPTTETSTPFTNPQICDPDGTEEYVTSVTSNGVPVGHVTEYDYDIKGLAEELIDVPDVPSMNGTYVLKATRTADGLTYNWVTG